MSGGKGTARQPVVGEELAGFTNCVSRQGTVKTVP